VGDMIRGKKRQGIARAYSFICRACRGIREVVTALIWGMIARRLRIGVG